MDPWLPYIYKYNKDWFTKYSKATILSKQDILTLECNTQNENFSNIRRPSEDWPPREYPKQS